MLKRRQSIWGSAACVALGASSSAAAPPVEAGTWSGILEIGALRLRLKLTIADTGGATLLSPDQGPTPYVGKRNAEALDKIDLAFDAIHARFFGRMVAPDRIEGQFRQGGTYPLVFQRGEAALGPLPPNKPLDQARLIVLRHLADAPAMAAASARKNGAAKFWIDGERQIGSKVAIQAGDLWHLGSITKSMTATLIARLVEDGVLRWGDSVGEILRDVAPDMPSNYRRATFRHLLCHRAGLQRDIDGPDFAKFSRDIKDARAERQAYARLALAQKPKGPPETTFEYSNSGYVIAGAMLETKLGTSWEDLIRTKLFEPLRLASAGFGPPGRKGAIDQPVGHARAAPDKPLRPFTAEGRSDNPVVLGPAGRVHMSLADLLRYLAAHRDGIDYLKTGSWKTLHTPPFGGDYAMGWIVRKDGSLWHNGSNTVWYAEVLIDAAAGTVAAAATNDGDRVKVDPAIGRALVEAAAAA